MPQMPWIRTSFQRSIAKNTSAQFIGRIISSLATLALTFTVARNFGSHGYGEFVKMTTFISFFYLIADFGFNAIYIQRSTFSSEAAKRQDDHWVILFVVRVFLSFLLSIIAFFIITLTPDSTVNGYSPLVHMGIIILLPSIFFQAFITTANGLFQKILRYEWAAVSVIIGSISSLITIGVLSANRAHSLLLLSTLPLLIGGAITTLVALLYIKRLQLRMPATPTVQDCTSLVYATVPLGLTLIFNVIYFHIDSIVLTFSRPTAEVGIYGLAYKVFELLLVVPTFFMNAVYPIMVQSAQKMDHTITGAFKKIVWKSAKLLLLSSLLLSVLVWFASPLLPYIKSDFIYSIHALRILILGLPFFFLSSLAMWILIALKKQWSLVLIYGGSMIGNIILNIYMVPSYGYVAAAWITIVSEAFILLISGFAAMQAIRQRE